jgi:hypothetical protein
VRASCFWKTGLPKLCLTTSRGPLACKCLALATLAVSWFAVKLAARGPTRYARTVGAIER